MTQVSKPALVLDTNVVLDWLLFDDPSALPIAAAVCARRVRWLATSAMRAEFAGVLQRGLAARHAASEAALLARWDRWAVVIDGPAPPPRAAPQCTDTDDQKFVDLALFAGAHSLLSRDRALLKLAGRAAALGLTILKPERWQAPG